MLKYLAERVRNNIRGTIKVIDLEGNTIKTIEHKQLIWYGHTKRLEDGIIPKTIIDWEPEEIREKEKLCRSMTMYDLLPAYSRYKRRKED